jgi:hypothetical protein
MNPRFCRRCKKSLPNTGLELSEWSFRSAMDFRLYRDGTITKIESNDTALCGTCAPHEPLTKNG